MTKKEFELFLIEVKEEIRIFERPDSANSQKMFDLLSNAYLVNTGVLVIFDEPERIEIILLKKKYSVLKDYFDLLEKENSKLTKPNKRKLLLNHPDTKTIQ